MMEVEDETVTITAGDKRFFVSKSKLERTDYYRTSLSMFKDEDEIPAPTTEYAISHYVKFLDRDVEGKKQKLKECFQHYFLIGDSDYLQHCVNKLLNHFSLYKDILTELNSDLQRDIYLNIPLDFVPDQFKKKFSFIDDWILNMARKPHVHIQVGDEIFMYKSMRQSDGTFIFKSFCQGKNVYVFEIPHGLEIIYYPNGQRKLEVWYRDGNRDGISRRWYSNGVLELEQLYINGRIHGPYREWYESRRKRVESDYVHGKKEGEYIHYDDNNKGTILNHFTYKDDKVISRKV